MKQAKLFLSRLLCLALIFCLFSCSSGAKAETGYLLLDGEKSTPDWVVEIGDEKISFAEYRHFYLNAKADIDADLDTFFQENPNAEADLKQTVLSYLREVYAVEVLAAEYGISLTDAEKQEIDKKIAQKKQEYGEELFLQFLNDSFLTEELYKKNLTNTALFDKTYASLTRKGGKLHATDDDLKTYLAENFYCYAQIYVDFRSGEGTITHPKTDTLISEIVNRLNDGDDFYNVAFSHSDDQTMMDYKNGYLNAKNILGEEKAEILSKLSEGEISEPYLSNDGYYIFKRLPISDAVIEENRDYLLNGYADANGNHINGMYENRFYELVLEAAGKLALTFHDCYELISSETLF